MTLGSNADLLPELPRIAPTPAVSATPTEGRLSPIDTGVVESESEVEDRDDCCALGPVTQAPIDRRSVTVVADWLARI